MALLVTAVSTATAQAPCGSTTSTSLRPPAVPLICHDTYFSIWSMSDKLTDTPPRHWTGASQSMAGLLRIDGKPYRFLGPEPGDVPAMEQKCVSILPTRTIYTFETSSVQLALTFLSPMLPDDLDLLSRPVTYIELSVTSKDGNDHEVSAYFDCSGEAVVNHPVQKVALSRVKVAGRQVLRIGSVEQPVLQKVGDDLRIDWGYLYLVPPPGASDVIYDGRLARIAFAQHGTIPISDDLNTPRPANDALPVLATEFKLGKVSTAPLSATLMLAYDDEYSVEYLQRKLRPYWRRNGWGVHELLSAALKEAEPIRERCEDFDKRLIKTLEEVGGPKYAALAALSYRQCLAASKLVADFDGTPLHFSKENFSNGCMATVDVIYPAAPLFLLMSPPLLKAQLTPLLDYSSSSRWKFPFAPHDLGTYPRANGQAYGGGERTEENQMPVEETGNMLILLAALAHAEGNASYADRYWPLLQKWANYLHQKGMDPENQLCTDDFAGHLAHNTNLSLKAIMGIAGFARLANQLGKTEDSTRYLTLAKEMAAEWMKKADDGDHYRLTFDSPGTWSQKYNLVWDRVLGFNLFPVSVAEKEVAWYLKKQNRFGLPLDNRKDYTKLDWVVWSATLATKRDDFTALVDPLFDFANETPDRVPLSDWFETKAPKHVGFRARSVVGGVFMPCLAKPAIWKDWLTKMSDSAH
ncbi:MAG: glutaminase domain-containing protein [Candidatus Sumerlaeaceae bacterium]